MGEDQFEMAAANVVKLAYLYVCLLMEVMSKSPMYVFDQIGQRLPITSNWTMGIELKQSLGIESKLLMFQSRIDY